MPQLTSLVLVVRSLEHALTLYEQLGFRRLGNPRNVPSLGAWQVVVEADNCEVELLEPHDQTRPPGLFLAARGEGVFALAVRIDDPLAVRARLRSAGIEPLGAEETSAAERWYLRPADAHGVLLALDPPVAG
jgi:hypothetical protein